eukprot:scaffold48466_cov76-Cyclotella_meneghiniana.AAC.1
MVLWRAAENLKHIKHAKKALGKLEYHHLPHLPAFSFLNKFSLSFPEVRTSSELVTEVNKMKMEGRSRDGHKSSRKPHVREVLRLPER